MPSVSVKFNTEETGFVTLVMSSLPHADSTQDGNGKCLDLLDYSVHSKKTTNIKIMIMIIIYHLKKLRFWV